MAAAATPPAPSRPTPAARGPQNFAQRGQLGVELKDAFQKASSGGIGAGVDHMKGVLDSKLTSAFGTPVAGALKAAARFFIDDLKAGLQEAMADLGLDRPLSNMVKTGAEWEAQMAKVNALTRSTKEQFESLKATSLSAVAGTHQTATQAARAMAKLAMGGLRGKDIETAVPHALKLASAGGVEVEEAAGHLIGIQHGMGLGMEDLGRIADNLAFSLGESRVPLHELVEGFKYAMPSARATGQSLEQLTAIIVELSRQEITGSMSGTVYRNMIKKTSDMSTEAREVMKEFGFSFQDAQGDFIGFDKVMDQFASNKKFQGLGKMAQSEVLNSMFETRASMGFMAMSGKGDEIRRLQGGAEGSKGLAGEMRTRQTDTLAGDWNKLKSVIETTFINIYQAVGPVIREMVGGFKDVFNAVKSVAAFLWDKFAPVFRVIGAAIQLVIAVSSAMWNALVEVGAAIMQAFKPITDLFGGIEGGFWGLLEAIIKTSAAALAWIIKTVGSFVAELVGVVGFVVEAFVKPFNAVKEFLTPIFDWISERWQEVKQIHDEIGKVVEGGKGLIKGAVKWSTLGLLGGDDAPAPPAAAVPPAAVAPPRAKTSAIDMDADIKRNKAIAETTTNMNKHVGTTKEAEEAARAFYQVQLAGGSQVAKLWHDSVMATKEYTGQIENLKKQGASAEQLAPVQKLADQARQQEFNKRVLEAAGGYAAQTNASKQAFASSSALFKLQREGAGLTAMAWHESVEATREYAQFIDDMAVKQPDNPMLKQLREGLQSARNSDFFKKLNDEAGKLWADSRTPLQSFSMRLKDLDDLQQRGLITARVYGDALKKAAEGAAGSAGITDLLTPWEQFQMQIEKVNQQFQNGQLDALFYKRAIMKAADAYDQMAAKTGAGSALMLGSSEAISAINVAQQVKPGESVANQIMAQQLAAINQQVGEQKQHRQENQKGFDELIKALGLKDKLPR